MGNDLKTKAIKAALSGDWKEAAKLNNKLLKENEIDCETLNRLALAYKALGNTKKSITVYQKVLKIDKYNSIALRNLSILKNGQKTATVNLAAQMVTTNSNIFLEEPGKTKIVSLVNLAPAPKILSLYPTESLSLCIKRKSVFVIDQKENYIGALPDDISYRLTKFMQYGYKYACFVKSVDKKGLSVLIKETERGKKLKNQPTFAIGFNDREYVTTINSPDTATIKTTKDEEYEGNGEIKAGDEE